MHLFLSPHFDDAALSCGGTIHRLARGGHEVHVLTVCAGPPPGGPYSELAARFHASAGAPGRVVAIRRGEERVAMAVLGCAFTWMDVPDAIYRRADGRWLYTSMQTLFGGAVHPSDRPVADRIAAAVRTLVPRTEAAVVYAPLGIGGHVDHGLARDAGLKLREDGRNVRFYEDFPYADAAFPHPAGAGEHTRAEAVLAPLRATGWQAHDVAFSDQDLEAKLASLRAYPSQAGFLGDAASLEARVRAFAGRAGLTRPSERFWTPKDR